MPRSGTIFSLNSLFESTAIGHHNAAVELNSPYDLMHELYVTPLYKNGKMHSLHTVLRVELLLMLILQLSEQCPQCLSPSINLLSKSTAVGHHVG